MITSAAFVLAWVFGRLAVRLTLRRPIERHYADDLADRRELRAWVKAMQP